MTKIDLITGFLGSGKTTFLRRYARYLIDRGMNIAILENDFGAINVDRMLLSDLEGESCDVEMVLGDKDYETHQRRFKTKLITLGMLGYDRVLVEPSGIYDVDEFFDTLQEEPLNRWYQIGSVIFILDAHLPEETDEETDYLMVSQLANAGKVVLSKSRQMEERYPRIVAHINRALEHFHCDRRLAMNEIETKPWDQLTDADLERICLSGYREADHLKLPVSREEQYDQLFYMNVRATREEIERELREIFADISCGRVLRIKGYLRMKRGGGKQEGGEQPGFGRKEETVRRRGEDQPVDGGLPAGWLKVNATADGIELTESQGGQEVLIVIGERLNKERISRHFHYSFGTDKTR